MAMVSAMREHVPIGGKDEFKEKLGEMTKKKKKKGRESEKKEEPRVLTL